MKEYSKYSNEEVKKNLELALKELYKNEEYLLRESAHERSLTYKLGSYLESLFPDYDVDCEYNLDFESPNHRKNWISPKVRRELKNLLIKIKEDVDPEYYDLEKEVQKVSRNFYPDIIVHKRGDNSHNLLVIEAKINKQDEFDKAKLIALTKKTQSVKGEQIYKYQLGAHIIFASGSKYSATEYQSPLYFIDGEAEVTSMGS